MPPRMMSNAPTDHTTTMPHSTQLLTILRAALLIFFASRIAFAQTPEEAKINNSAEHWMTICKSVVNADVGNNGIVHLPDSLDAGRCLGAFETLHSLAYLQSKGKPVLGICQSPK